MITMIDNTARLSLEEHQWTQTASHMSINYSRDSIYSQAIKLKMIFKIAAVLMIPVTANGDSSAKVHIAIKKMYDIQNNAAEHKNIDKLMNIYSPKFIMCDAHGALLLDRTQVRQHLIRLFASSLNLKGKTTILSCTIVGNTVQTVTKEHDVVVVRNPQTQQVSTICYDEIDKGIWKKKSEKWREEALQIVSEKKTVDGQSTPR